MHLTVMLYIADQHLRALPLIKVLQSMTGIGRSQMQASPLRTDPDRRACLPGAFLLALAGGDLRSANGGQLRSLGPSGVLQRPRNELLAMAEKTDSHGAIEIARQAKGAGDRVDLLAGSHPCFTREAVVANSLRGTSLEEAVNCFRIIHANKYIGRESQFRNAVDTENFQATDYRIISWINCFQNLCLFFKGKNVDIRIEEFDYSAPAELFAQKRKKYGPINYRRFETAAEAIRYAIEDLSRSLLDGTFIETGAERLDGKSIRQLYGSDRYPLKRAATG